MNKYQEMAYLLKSIISVAGDILCHVVYMHIETNIDDGVVEDNLIKPTFDNLEKTVLRLKHIIYK